jgi:hypothetical protein
MRVEKKIRALNKKLGALKHLSEDERLIYAQSLSMTPDQRWRANLTSVRLLSCSKPSRRRKSVSS